MDVSLDSQRPSQRTAAGPATDTLTAPDRPAPAASTDQRPAQALWSWSAAGLASVALAACGGGSDDTPRHAAHPGQEPAV